MNLKTTIAIIETEINHLFYIILSHPKYSKPPIDFHKSLSPFSKKQYHLSTACTINLYSTRFIPDSLRDRYLDHEKED